MCALCSMNAIAVVRHVFSTDNIFATDATIDLSIHSCVKHLGRK